MNDFDDFTIGKRTLTRTEKAIDFLYDLKRFIPGIACLVLIAAFTFASKGTLEGMQAQVDFIQTALGVLILKTYEVK